MSQHVDVSSGRTIDGAVVLSGGTLDVLAGGRAKGTILSSGGTETVTARGFDVAAQVSGGTQFVYGVASSATIFTGAQVVESGGNARATTLSGGSEIVSAGGKDSAARIVGGIQYIYGGFVSRATIAGVGSQVISGAGSATSTTIASGGTQQVFDGGMAAATTILSGGFQYIGSGTLGGTAIRTTISKGGVQFVGYNSGAGIASNTNVRSGGTELVSAGTVFNTNISSGGAEIVSAGGITSGATVLGGGVLTVLSGGLAASAKTLKRGTETISSGGVDLGALISSGGTQLNFGCANGVTIFTGGTQIVGSGGTAGATIVSRGATLEVLGGGVVAGAQIASGGIEEVASGSTASGLTISAGGALEVGPGGTASFLAIGSGGRLIVLAGGSAVGTTIGLGGTEIVSSGGMVTDHVVSRGGRLTMSGGTIGLGATIVVESGGTLTVGGTVINSGTLIANGSGSIVKIVGVVSGGSSEIGSGQVEITRGSSESVSFLPGTTGKLVLDSSATFTGTISGFAGPDHPFTNFFAFGDSSIDTGYFTHAPMPDPTLQAFLASAIANGGTGTPVGVGLMSPQILAGYLGLTASPVDAPGGGTNYAIYGAFNAADAANGYMGNNLNGGRNLPSTVQQIQEYLAANGGVADPNAVYMISSGGNDVIYSLKPGLGASFIKAHINELVTEIKALQAAGAQHIVVVDDYTGFLYPTLDAARVNYVKSSVYSVINIVKAHPTLFGFTAQTVQPGRVGQFNNHSALLSPIGSTRFGFGLWGANSTTPSAAHSYLRAPNAEQTSLYADDVHLSDVGQRIDANYNFTQLVAYRALAIDKIDLKDISYAFGATTATYAGTASGGILRVTDGVHTANLRMIGDYRTATFITMADGSGGTLVVDPPASGDATATLAQDSLSGVRYQEAIAEGFNKGILDFSLSKNVILSDDGTITLSYPTQIISQHRAVTLTNVNDVLAGSGIIGDSFLALVNDAAGVINANDTQNALIINTPRFAMNNEGLLEATGAGWLDIDHTSVANGSTGIVRASGVGSRIDLDSATIVDGTVLVDEGSIIDTINGGASAIASASVINAGTIAASYGNLTLAGSVTNPGVLSAAHASHLKITGAVTGSGSATIASNGIIEFATASDANVTFLDATGTLRLDADTKDPSKFTGKVWGFGGRDRIDLTDIGFGPHTTLGYSMNKSGGTLTVEDGAHVASIALLGNYMATSFVLSPDGHGGTLVTEKTQVVQPQPTLTHPHA